MVRPKKFLGQHFLKDQNIAKRITESTELSEKADIIIEIGPGTGVLTQFLFPRYGDRFHVVELDRESVNYLQNIYPREQIIEADFLKMNLQDFNKNNITIIGNFPYNISSQIVFKMLENRELITELTGMFQKEVAERITSKPGNKSYGILSVLTQAYYHTEYLFTVEEHVFDPPPKVKSGVIRLTRHRTEIPGCNEKKFKQLVKLAFNQRRKTLRNALKSILPPEFNNENLKRRAEELSYEEFIDLTNELGI